MQDQSMQTLGERIRALRDGKHLSTRDLATAATDFDGLMKYHPRPVIETITRRLFQDPNMLFAARRIFIEENVNASNTK